MNSEEKLLIDLYLKKIGREDLKCERLYRRSYQAVIDVLEMLEWQDERFKELLTSSIWESNYDEIKNVLAILHPDDPDNPDKTIWDDERFTNLLTPSIWNSNYEDVKNILTMPHPDYPDNSKKILWDDNRFKRLLTSSIWGTNYENISAKLAFPFWSNPLYTHLLTSSIWSVSTEKIEKVIKSCKELSLLKYITTAVLRRSPIQIKALYHYLVENKIPVIKNDKLHPIFNVMPGELKTRYGLDMKVLVAQERKRMKLAS